MMNATHTMPSPVSPYGQPTKHSFSAPRPYHAGTPAPDMSPRHHHHQHQHHQHSLPYPENRGLGLSMSMSYPPQSTISPIVNSPHSEWSHPSHSMEPQHHPEYTMSQAPDISTAAFDPFAGFGAASYNGMVGTQSPEAPSLEFCHSPPSSNIQSHRGSVSSGAPSDTSEQAYTPRPLKGDEAGGEWYPASNGELHRTITQAPMSYIPGVATLNSQTEDILYRPQPTDWTKQHEMHVYGEHQTSPIDDRLPPMASMQPVVPSISRTQKPKRHRTTPEEATHECNVCGKLFKRSYNYKSHLDTHNPERKYPHPCTKTVGSSQCTKKFQRKTDLDRHIDSVHEKKRAYQCDLCGNRFARRDTLRRHSEDGCPKRFELPLRDGQQGASGSSSATPAPPSAPQPQRFAFQSPAPDYSRPRSYSQAGSMAPPPPVSSAPFAMHATPAPFYARS